MNSAHLHIVLNHFPFIITAIALLVAGVAFVTQQAVIKRLALGMMVLIALSAANCASRVESLPCFKPA